MPIFATPPLIEQWANNIEVTEPIYGSWIEAIAQKYGAQEVTGDRLADIAIKLGVKLNSSTGDHYHDICIELGNNNPLNGSYLERIVQLTTPA
jgi:hypothetical protein